tara:strand:+ start:176 stop:1450 length:1275 start_codon:yes stop_codon:yes gene_type:complete
MGWLRKVGRKISKGLGKVFGSKLGAVIGAVGLYMLMGPVAKTLTGWASSAFGGGAAAAGSASAQLATTATAEAAAASTIASTTATAGTALTEAQILAGATPATLAAGTSQGISLGSTLSTAGAEIAATTGQAAVGAEAALAEQALLAGENASLLAGSGSSVIPQNAAQQATSASSLTQAEQLANATNNMDKANAAISAIDSASVTGSLNVSPTITDSLIQDAIPAIEQNAAVVRANVAELASGTDSLSVNLNAVTTPATTAQAATTVSAPFPGTEAINTQMSPVEPDAFKKLLADAPAATTTEPNLFAKGYNALTELPGKAWKGVTSGEFVGDVAQGVFTGVAMNAIAGSPEEQFVSGGVASQPMQEAAQANYIQEVGPSAMAASGLSRMPTFQELSQQTLYGTGSPNYLSQFYQPLATPQAIG